RTDQYSPIAEDNTYPIEHEAVELVPIFPLVLEKLCTLPEEKGRSKCPHLDSPCYQASLGLWIVA
ncbi:ras-related protein Rab-2A-like protein, partial [Cricetulus griseus]